MKQINRDNKIDVLQSAAYQFPYHYIPQAAGFPNFSRNWAFSASYIAALNLFSKWMLLLASDKSNFTHMDFGCGDGGFVNTVRANKDFRNLDFKGIDFDENAVRWAHLFSNGEAEFIVGDIADLPSKQYDSGSLIEVYEHIPPSECARFLSSIAASLKDGAGMFVTVPSTQKPTSAKHYRHFDFDTLKSEFGVQFEIEEIFGFEKKSFLVKLMRRLTVNKHWYLETPPTNRLMVRKLEAKHGDVRGCGRIGLILRKREASTQ